MTRACPEAGGGGGRLWALEGGRVSGAGQPLGGHLWKRKQCVQCVSCKARACISGREADGSVEQDRPARRWTVAVSSLRTCTACWSLLRAGVAGRLWPQVSLPHLPALSPQLLAALAARPAVRTRAAMARGRVPLRGLAPHCLWLLGVILLMDVSARPANHSSARERAGSKDEPELLPPDHLNGVKLEMDGHLNKDFHQEVFLGKDMDGFEEDAEPRRSRRKLMVLFSK